MKKILSFLFLTPFLFSCGNKDNKSIDPSMETTIEIQPITDEVLESAVIYEANIRQYSPEGTFEAFTKDIPQLKELGVKIIWVMPIFPISEVKRKAFGDLMIEDIEDLEERKKYLGSYYAVSDFKAINPEFGDLNDFRKLLQTAHDNDMYVILDWVPNHTGWDHKWIFEHPDYYTKNAQGEITDPLNEDGTPVGWQDVADLNYENMEMQEEMINDMMYWVKEEGIDGFRCDMAGMVPTSFWKKAIPRLRAEKDIFMLAESDYPELTDNNLFEMLYGWEVHHIFNAIAKGEKDVSSFDGYMTHRYQKWKQQDIIMNFVTNHDENSWAGSVKERMGPAADAITALTYCMPGMPLIYSGQEYNLEKRLKFFEKDSIPKEKRSAWELLSKLGELKNNSKGMWGGKDAASYERLNTTDDTKILAFRRKKDGKELVYIANLSGKEVEFNINLEGAFTNAMTDGVFNIKEPGTQKFAPWEYVILTK
ncbi:MAG: alpha-amylase [Flavobacteriaceae bacterium]|nr:alpha-amylase [Flavobacteriaceae bacterium]